MKQRFVTWCWLSVAVLGVAVNVAAQGSVVSSAEKLPAVIGTKQLVQVENGLLQSLENLVAQSCRDAQEVASSAEASSVLLPGVQLSEPLQWDAQTVYPQLTFNDPQAVSHYFLLRNNLEVRHYRQKTALRRKQVQARLDEFLANYIPVEHAPVQDMAWLAGQLPENTQTLLLGEQHFYSEIQQQVSEFLSQLRNRFADRKIILFTEFLPQGKVWGQSVTQTLHASYRAVWQNAQTLHIPVVGLKPEFVEQNKKVCILGQDTERSQQVWVSAEGLRLRNVQWVNVLSAYRQRYPDALFIVYGGARHMEGTEPYALSRLWAQESTFTAVLYPQISDRTNLFEIWTRGLFDQERVLFFERPDLADLAGFNVRIRIPVEPQVTYR